MKKTYFATVLSLSLLMGTAACTTNDHTTAGLGLSGATVGAVAAGGLTGNPGAAVVGAVAGGALGTYLGKHVVQENGKKVTKCRYKDKHGKVVVAACKKH